MSSINLTAGAFAMGNYGPGAGGNRPVLGRWVLFRAINNANMFIPQNSQAERTSVYNSNAFQQRYTGQYGRNTGGVAGSDPYRLYNNNAALGNGPCWTGNTGGNNSNYNTPPACPGTFPYDEGVDNEKPVNPNLYAGQATIQHQTAPWTFYQNKGYGCGAGNSTGVSNRWCYRGGYDQNNTTFQVF